jgi:hypothetical protein
MPYKSVRGLTNLRVSPLGVIPQRNRRPRTIVDYASTHECTDQFHDIVTNQRSDIFNRPDP